MPTSKMAQSTNTTQPRRLRLTKRQLDGLSPQKNWRSRVWDDYYSSGTFWQQQKEKWDLQAQTYRESVEQAIQAAQTIPDMTWRKGSTDHLRNITVLHLALTLFAVATTEFAVQKVLRKVSRNRHGCRRTFKTVNRQQFGLSLKNLNLAFQALLGVGCHRAKCVKILALLQELNLISKAKNYKIGERGNVYISGGGGVWSQKTADENLGSAPVLLMGYNAGLVEKPSGVACVSEYRAAATKAGLIHELGYGLLDPTAAERLVKKFNLLAPKIGVEINDFEPDSSAYYESVYIPMSALIHHGTPVVVTKIRLPFQTNTNSQMEVHFLLPGYAIPCWTTTISQNIQSTIRKLLEAESVRYPPKVIGHPKWRDLNDHDGHDHDIYVPPAPSQKLSRFDTDAIFANASNRTLVSDINNQINNDRSDVAREFSPKINLEQIDHGMQTSPAGTNWVQSGIEPVAHEYKINSTLEAKFIKTGRAFDVEVSRTSYLQHHWG